MAIKPEERGSLKQFAVQPNKVSWRQEEVNIAGNALKTITFLDTKPNMFFVQNPNNSTLHIGISHIPTSKNYEFRIPENSSKTFGRPTGTGTLYILNKSNTPVTISLFSLAGDFDMSILNQTDIDLRDSNVSYDGIINGFGNNVSLPTGNNTIGKVMIDGNIVTEMSATEKSNIEKTRQSIEWLISGNEVANRYIIKDIVDKLTKVIATIETGNSTVSDMETFISNINNSVSVINGSVSNLKDLITSIDGIVSDIKNATGEKVTSNVGFYQQESLTESTAITFADEDCNPNHINFITNDGETDINVTLYFTETNSKTIVLKKGDSLNDLGVTLYGMTISPKTSGDAISWRMMTSVMG